MLKSLKKTKSEGFTIIEVMIVLAIAGLILLIVFLAIPSLQRNSRNTQRKTDISNVTAALNEYISNNQGKLPTSASDFQNNVMNNVKLGYYAASSNIVFASDAPGSAPTADVENAYVWGDTKCNGNTYTDGTARQAAVVYWVETANGTQPQCLDT